MSAEARCPLPHCTAELRLSVTSDFVVEDTVTPVSDLDQRHSIVDYSLWLNGTYPPDLSEETVHWRRVLKVTEEAGEVRGAMGAWVGENPRKPKGDLTDLLAELADCVGAALGAIEHLTGHEGRSLDIATERVRFVCERVGVDTGAASPTEQATEGGAK